MYHLNYYTPHPVTGQTWDDEADEPAAGGRCVESGPLREMMRAWWEYAPAARRQWGPGEFAITDDEGRRVPVRYGVDVPAPMCGAAEAA